jgi:hypothetical protein
MHVNWNNDFHNFNLDDDLNASIERREEVDGEVAEIEQHLQNISQEYVKLKTLMDQKGYARTRRQNTKTTIDMISDLCSSVRYRRRQETKNVLEYIHGGEVAAVLGAVLGAWDFVTAHADKDLMDSLISKYKRVKYLQGVINKAMNDHKQYKDSLNQALAFKYQNFLSLRKFNLMCKTQSSVFDPDAEVWLPRNMKCLGVDVESSLSRVSDDKIDKFVKSLDIGSISQIPNAPGVTRTITGLVFMIIDFHLRLPHLFQQFLWFNENTNHFIFQFSDDGPLTQASSQCQ